MPTYPHSSPFDDPSLDDESPEVVTATAKKVPVKKAAKKTTKKTTKKAVGKRTSLKPPTLPPRTLTSSIDASKEELRKIALGVLDSYAQLVETGAKPVQTQVEVQRWAYIKDMKKAILNT